MLTSDQNSSHDSSACGLAKMKNAAAKAAAVAVPRSASARVSLSVSRNAAATSSGSTTIPAVYLVAAASPRPIPATTQSSRRPRTSTPALPHADTASGSNAGTSFSARWE